MPITVFDETGDGNDDDDVFDVWDVDDEFDTLDTGDMHIGNCDAESSSSLRLLTTITKHVKLLVFQN